MNDIQYVLNGYKVTAVYSARTDIRKGRPKQNKRKVN